MDTKTKACNLTMNEIIALIMLHGREMDEDNLEETLERINYLNKRLKSFSEAEPIVKEAAKPEPETSKGWGS